MPIQFVDSRNPVHRIRVDVVERLADAQRNAFPLAFPDAYDFLERASNEIRLKIAIPDVFRSKTAIEIAEKTSADLQELCLEIVKNSGVPMQAALPHAATLAERVHLLRAIDDPDRVISRIREKIISVVQGFPKTAGDLERGRNPGDVLDP